MSAMDAMHAMHAMRTVVLALKIQDLIAPIALIASIVTKNRRCV
jgi:hypothetical protein